MSPSPPPDALALLTAAADSEDADLVEEAVCAAYKGGLRAELVPILLKLLGRTQHTRHEDIVRALQELKDPRAVPALHAAALVRHGYLDFDDVFGLARKCTWALADIGTPVARLALEDLSSIQNPLIAGYAARRLEQWEQEIPRKGTIRDLT